MNAASRQALNHAVCAAAAKVPSEASPTDLSKPAYSTKQLASLLFRHGMECSAQHAYVNPGTLHNCGTSGWRNTFSRKRVQTTGQCTQRYRMGPHIVSWHAYCYSSRLQDCHHSVMLKSEVCIGVHLRGVYMTYQRWTLRNAQ